MCCQFLQLLTLQTQIWPMTSFVARAELAGAAPLRIRSNQRHHGPPWATLDHQRHNGPPEATIGHQRPPWATMGQEPWPRPLQAQNHGPGPGGPRAMALATVGQHMEEWPMLTKSTGRMLNDMSVAPTRLHCGGQVAQQGPRRLLVHQGPRSPGPQEPRSLGNWFTRDLAL